jgi:hypothetical protein
MAAAKEETTVIYDLARFFGYLNTMETEGESDLSLSSGQLDEIFTIMTALTGMERVEVDWAEEKLVSLEEEVLTVDQLIYVDMPAIDRLENRISDGTGNGKGSGGGDGGGVLADYAAGGAFNPVKDATKSMGSDFAEFLEYVAKKLGKTL